MPRRPAAAMLAAALLGLLLTLAGPARPANAHAVLTTSTPAPGSVVAVAPQTVRLIFNEPVQIVPGRTQVIAPSGKRVHDGDLEGSGTGWRIQLRPTDRPLGTYLVSYRVISADGHPLSGTFTFSVGAPSATAPRPVRQGAHPVVAVAVPAAKYAGYTALALIVGPALLLLTLWPRRLPTRIPLRLARTGLGGLAVATLAGLWWQVPYSTGSGPLDVSLIELRTTLTSRWGTAMLLRLGVVAAIAALLGPALAAGRTRRRRSARAGRGTSRRGWSTVLAALALLGLATWPLAGHPAASPQPWLSTIADMVHLAAMAVWLGGLITLVPLLRHADRRELTVLLPVWSRYAAVAMYWLVAAGVVQALVQVGGPTTLTATGYGRLVLTKAALLAGVLVVAGYARRLARPQPASGAETDALSTGAEPVTDGGGGEAGRNGDSGNGDSGVDGNGGASGRGDSGVDDDRTDEPRRSDQPPRPARARRADAACRRHQLRRMVTVELGIAGLILAASAAATQHTPGRAAGVEAAAAARARGFATTLVSPLYSVQFEVFPAQVGTANTLHAFLYTPAGTPLRAVEWKVTGALPDAGVEPIDNPVVTIRGNQGIGAINFPVPGRWVLRLTIRISETEQATVGTTVLVR